MRGGLRSATGELKSRDGRGCIAHHTRPEWKIRRALEMGVGPAPPFDEMGGY